MKLKSQYILVPFVALLSACTIHSDHITSFEISGAVTVSDNGVEGAKVIFVDTGYDSVRSKQSEKKEVGKTDEKGRVSGKIDYWWGHDKGIFGGEPKETFDIVIEKAGCDEKTLHFDGRKLGKEKATVHVDIGRVELACGSAEVLKK